MQNSLIYPNNLVTSIARGAVGRPVRDKDGKQIGSIISTTIEDKKIIAKIKMYDGTEYQSVIAQVDETPD